MPLIFCLSVSNSDSFPGNVVFRSPNLQYIQLCFCIVGNDVSLHPLLTLFHFESGGGQTLFLDFAPSLRAEIAFRVENFYCGVLM